MLYLVNELLIYLVIAFLIGIAVGWWTSEPRRRT